MAMTKTKLLQVARNTPSQNGFKVDYYHSTRAGKSVWKVRLDPGEGINRDYPILYTSANQYSASDERDRFHVWLSAEGLIRK